MDKWLPVIPYVVSKLLQSTTKMNGYNTFGAIPFLAFIYKYFKKWCFQMDPAQDC